MYCKNCGKEFDEGTNFCNACGNAVENNPSKENETVDTVAQKGTTITIPPVFINFLPELKSLFSKRPEKSISIASNSTGFEWAIWAVVTILSFGFSAAVMPLYLIKSLVGSMKESYLSYVEYPFGTLFGLALLVGLIAYTIFSAGYWLFNCVTHKKLIHICKTLNVVSCSLIPFCAICLLNMLLGLMWYPLTIYTALLGGFLFIALVYTGLQRFEGADVSAVWGFGIAMALLAALILLAWNFIYYDAAEEFISKTVDFLINWF